MGDRDFTNNEPNRGAAPRPNRGNHFPRPPPRPRLPRDETYPDWLREACRDLHGLDNLRRNLQSLEYSDRPMEWSRYTYDVPQNQSVRITCGPNKVLIGNTNPTTLKVICNMPKSDIPPPGPPQPPQPPHPPQPPPRYQPSRPCFSSWDAYYNSRPTHRSWGPYQQPHLANYGTTAHYEPLGTIYEPPSYYEPVPPRYESAPPGYKPPPCYEPAPPRYQPAPPCYPPAPHYGPFISTPTPKGSPATNYEPFGSTPTPKGSPAADYEPFGSTPTPKGSPAANYEPFGSTPTPKGDPEDLKKEEEKPVVFQDELPGYLEELQRRVYAKLMDYFKIGP